MLSQRLLFPPQEEYPEGYDASFLMEVREELHCPICMLVAREAVVTEDCGHLFCQGCMALSVKRTPECPVCRMKVDSTNSVRRDVRARREIGNLPVACSNQAVGCGWRGTLLELERHTQEACDYAIVPCSSPYCGLVMQRRFLAKHGPSCRGARAPEELQRRMHRSAVKVQALFRGHRTRVRFRYLLMLQDKEMSLHNRMFRHIISRRANPRQATQNHPPPPAPAPMPAPPSVQPATVPVHLMRQLQAPSVFGQPSLGAAPQMNIRFPSPPVGGGRLPDPSLLQRPMALPPSDLARSCPSANHLALAAPVPLRHHGSASSGEEAVSNVSDCGDNEIEDTVEPEEDAGHQILRGTWHPDQVDEALDAVPDPPTDHDDDDDDSESIVEETLHESTLASNPDLGAGTPSMSFSAHRDPHAALSLESIASLHLRRQTIAVVDVEAGDWQDVGRRRQERRRRASEPVEEVLEETICQKFDTTGPEPLVLATQGNSPNNVRASGHTHISRDRIVALGTRPKARSRHH